MRDSAKVRKMRLPVAGCWIPATAARARQTLEDALWQREHLPAGWLDNELSDPRLDADARLPASPRPPRGNSARYTIAGATKQKREFSSGRRNSRELQLRARWIRRRGLWKPDLDGRGKRNNPGRASLEWTARGCPYVRVADLGGCGLGYSDWPTTMKRLVCLSGSITS